ncbi:PhnD/SsuA/transferrin family substrate-binding protein [Rhodococcus rhodochrous]|uniref:PhnD/SsuA/transferrin family substrate-binding protein n=1 Tax=Rhodococcus rhodochrous TaxID=1829 RepID=A0AAW4XLW7_RHORH|nr:PhnD/SsuA/transferrin family substrate-binding protein [Rhodococcus rhodochrous]MCD2113799.1 PhnD/SsuA/transferrin family substrate-binding protein [Rhodococcus rhodochrous]
MFRSVRSRWLVVPSLAVLFAASACGLGGGDGQEALAEATIAHTGEGIPEGVKLVVAEQNASRSQPLYLSGAGEDLPYDLEFADFSGGPAVIEALRSGAADIGSLGEAPIPIAVPNGITDIVAIALEANPGSSGGYFLVAQPGSGIETVADLKGKKVAYPPGTGRHMIVAGLLAKAGLDPKTDIDAVELAGAEVAPTFSSGAVDAAILTGVQYYKVGSPPILGDGTGINTGINTLIVRKQILEDPAKAAAIGDYVGRSVAANNWIGRHPDEWVAAYHVGTQGMTPEEGRELLDHTGTGRFYPIDEKSIALFQSVSDGLYETGTMSVPVDISPYVDGRYNDIVVAQNEADDSVPDPLP